MQIVNQPRAFPLTLEGTARFMPSGQKDVKTTTACAVPALLTGLRFLLSVVRRGAVLAKEVLIVQMFGDGASFRISSDRDGR